MSDENWRLACQVVGVLVALRLFIFPTASSTQEVSGYFSLLRTFSGISVQLVLATELGLLTNHVGQ